MASIVITISTDGAAFHDGRSPHFDRLARAGELARILRKLAVQCEYGEDCKPPKDIDGKVVGTVEVIE